MSEPTTVVGNGAKMLSSLKAIVDVFDSKEPMAQQEREIVVYNLAKAALAEPPRNCDRFARYYEALLTFMPISDPNGVVIIDFAKWLFAPYESDVAK